MKDKDDDDSTEAGSVRNIGAETDSSDEGCGRTTVGGFNSNEPGSPSQCSTSSSRSGIPSTLIIFDWDDTILPTSWLFQIGAMSEEADNPLLDESAAGGIGAHSGNTIFRELLAELAVAAKAMINQAQK